MSNIPADDLTNSVSKLVELNQQIKEARSDIKVLSQAEKALKLHIKKLMVDNGLDVINTKTGKITVKKSVRKVGLNKDTIREGLSVFFEGNEEQAEISGDEISDESIRRLTIVLSSWLIFSLVVSWLFASMEVGV